MEFKDRLVFVRATLDLSQKALAERLGVSYPTINRWEHGRVQPTRKALVRFEQFCQENNMRFPDNNCVQGTLTEQERSHVL